MFCYQQNGKKQIYKCDLFHAKNISSDSLQKYQNQLKKSIYIL